MRILIGSTGFVGSALSIQSRFDLAVHRPDAERVRDSESDELVCAGLPAAKYVANRDPDADWANVVGLAGLLATARAGRFVLISTVDVYQPPRGVTEAAPATFAGPEAYGRNRAWFEAFVRAQFPDHTVVRLPGLFGDGLRKNLVYDLLEGREEQWTQVDAGSTFQFFDVRQTWSVVQAAREEGVRLVNVATEPVTAQAVADIFGVTLGSTGRQVHYDVRSDLAGRLGGADGYLQTADQQLAGIARLAESWPGRVAQ
jgi:nucleoside-diphosphate-sugar epimerase